jgi:hypothetical protein
VESDIVNRTTKETFCVSQIPVEKWKSNGTVGILFKKPTTKERSIIQYFSLTAHEMSSTNQRV